MKLYLASSLCFVSDVIEANESLEWKKVWCIWNWAKQRGWKNAWRNQRDLKFFEKNKCTILDIDISKHTESSLTEILKEIDIIFVWWWDTEYLATLITANNLERCIKRAVEQWLVYMWTSAWSMIASTEMHYNDWAKRLQWIWLTELNVIPHWNQLWHKKHWLDQMDIIYSFEYPSILLNDITVIISDWSNFSLHKSKNHTLESVIEKINEEWD